MWMWRKRDRGRKRTGTIKRKQSKVVNGAHTHTHTQTYSTDSQTTLGCKEKKHRAQRIGWWGLIWGGGAVPVPDTAVCHGPVVIH